MFINKAKLWYFWNIHLKKNEFSSKLGILFIYDKFRKMSINERNNILVARRQLAHDLDNGASINLLATFTKTIKKARL